MSIHWVIEPSPLARLTEEENEVTEDIPVVPDEVIPPVYEVGVVPAGADMTETRVDYLPTPAEVVSKMGYQVPKAVEAAAEWADSDRPWVDAGPPPGSPARPRRHRRRTMKDSTIALWLASVFAAFIVGLAYALIFVK